MSTIIDGIFVLIIFALLFDSHRLRIQRNEAEQTAELLHWVESYRMSIEYNTAAPRWRVTRWEDKEILGTGDTLIEAIEDAQDFLM